MFSSTRVLANSQESRWRRFMALNIYAVSLVRPFAVVFCASDLIMSTVSMPDLIAHTNMDAQAVTRLREELFKMTQFLSKHTDKYLSTEYEHAPNDYVDSVK